MGQSANDVVVVANRLPVDATAGPDGSTHWEQSPGGLVTALDPLLRERPVTWIGWSGRFADDAADAVPLPDRVGSCDLVEVPLTRSQVEDYYEGFCNATIWPLYHDAIVAPVYHRRTWEAYQQVNRVFADAVAAVAAPGATVWVHDYQLQLVPQFVRQVRPDVTIGFFLHIPFPPHELFAQLPWRRQIIEGMLGADLVGFHRPEGVLNFLVLAHRLCGLSPESGSVQVRGLDDNRTVRVGAFPISIDSRSLDSLARDPQVREKARLLRHDLGNPGTILLGVDRLDYTKGIDVRLKAFAELLDDGDLDPTDVTLVQVATPSREGVEEYQRIRQEIELVVGRALGDHGAIGSVPVRYLHQSMPREELVAFYVAADIMLVTPLRDGMNLVCKEYVACRTDEDGALVLSEFTGASAELSEAYLVNPYDAEGVKRAILDAVHAPQEDRMRRMRSMRATVFDNDVERWGTSFLEALRRAGHNRYETVDSRTAAEINE